MSKYPINNRPAIGICDDSHNGLNHRYTLTTFTGYLISEAEKRYLDRDSDWTFLGITFAKSGPPQIWYPNTGKHVIIVLSELASYEPVAAKCELAHEVIHLLDPNQKAVLLEEGLAVLFCEEMANEGGYNAPPPGRYLEARNAVEELLMLYPNAIKTLRQKDKNCFSNVDEKMITDTFHSIDPALAKKLCRTLPRE